MDRNEEMMKHLASSLRRFCRKVRVVAGQIAKSTNGWNYRREIHAAGSLPKIFLAVAFLCCRAANGYLPSFHVAVLLSTGFLGPLGHLSVICRNTFHEFGAFTAPAKKRLISYTAPRLGMWSLFHGNDGA
jgi:hypothetical protein